MSGTSYNKESGTRWASQSRGYFFLFLFVFLPLFQRLHIVQYLASRIGRGFPSFPISWTGLKRQERVSYPREKFTSRRLLRVCNFSRLFFFLQKFYFVFWDGRKTFFFRVALMFAFLLLCKSRVDATATHTSSYTAVSPFHVHALCRRHPGRPMGRSILHARTHKPSSMCGLPPFYGRLLSSSGRH